jgi:thiamine pyrophosphokinase
MRAAIFVNGVISDPAHVRHLLRPDDDLIAADGGALHALAAGKRPRVVVGDLDSLEPEVLAQLEADGVELERHPVAKNETDLELAILRAIRDGADEILLIGALGGRLDQSLANVLLMAQRPWPVKLSLVDGDQRATVLRGGERMALAGAPGSLVSLLPLSPEVTGITYTGMQYPLDNATLPFGSTRGVSNAIAAQPATLTIATGLALVIQTQA